MFSKTYSAVLNGLEAQIIDVEVDVSKGIPAFGLIGLADKSINEARERVNIAMKASDFPLAPKRILVNLAPADIRKEGPQMDLAIAAALMQNFSYLNCDEDFLKDFCFIAELSLTGQLRPVNGVLALASAAIAKGIKHLVLAHENKEEAKLASIRSGIKVFTVKNLDELKVLIDSLYIDQPPPKNFQVVKQSWKELSQQNISNSKSKDFSDVVGQSHAKRGLEIAAAGQHHLLMIGPPGCGKSMLSKRFSSLLPELSFEEALNITKIYSVAGLLKENFIKSRPLRSPHHSISSVSLSGGGIPIRPGEVSLAHHGVLFLDEFTEFNRYTIEQLRQIMDNKSVRLNKNNRSFDYPADFLLIAACNPCPCGFLGDLDKECHCSSYQVQRYLSKLSGPLLDRIDIHLELSKLSKEEFKDLSNEHRSTDNYSSSSMLKRIEAAQAFEQELHKSLTTKDKASKELSIPESKSLFKLDKETKKFLHEAVFSLNLSARAYEKIVKIARTIANLAQSRTIKIEHIAEAVQYRSLDFEKWR